MHVVTPLHPSATSTGSHFILINVLKAIAAQLIVLHHLALYGPMADVAWLLLPALFDWFNTNGRIAVQAFLVIGGFLAAKSLAPDGLSSVPNPWSRVGRRYAKLMPPFVVAMLFAIAASALARTWMTHDSISAPASLPQLAAHGLMLHDVLGYESLSAGAWYVAIDFQLYALITMTIWLCGRAAPVRPNAWLVPLATFVLASASLLYFNRDASFDLWAPYFFGSYGLGALAWWAGDPKRGRSAAAVLIALMILTVLAALALDFRSRIAVALAVACALIMFGRTRLSLDQFPGLPLLNYLGTISYSIFLIHFPVSLVVNAAFTRFTAPEPAWQAVGVALAWLASVAAGAAFHRWIEAPLGRVVWFAPSTVPASRAAA